MPAVTPQCVLCEFVITYVEKSVGNNHSIAAIDAAFEKVCNILPASLQDNCTHFVHLFGPAIALLIMKNETAQQICTSLKICNGTDVVARPNFNIIEVETPKANPVECAVCQFVVGYVDKYIQNNKSQAAVDAALEKVCGLLPHALNATCVSFVDQYAPVLLQYIIAHGTPDAVCQALHLCSNKSESVIVQEKPKANPVECAVCQFVVGYVDKYIQNNKSQAAVDAALEKVCGLLPHALNATCVSFVDQYAPVLLQYIIAHGTPDAVCQALHLCSNKSESVIVQEKTTLTASTQCVLCEFVVTYVEKAVGDNKSAAAVEAMLDKACALLPATLQPQCIKFVNESGPYIATFISQNLTVAQICDSLKMCINGTVAAVEIEEPKANPVECAVCQFVVGYVDKYIQNNKSQAAVDAALEKVCGLLPHALNATCVSFVDQYAPVLLQYIIAHGTPDAVCQALHLCSNKSETIVPKMPAVTPQCVLCEFVITYVEKSVGNNHSIAAIDAALEKVCNILPASLQDNCTHFVHLFGPAIALLIMKNETAQQICTSLKICNGTDVVARPNFNIIEVETPKVNPVECAICQFVVGYVDKYIQNNKSQAAVDAALEKVCALLPHALNASCVSFVDQYAPVLLQYIIAHGTPDAVCQALHLCSNKSESVIVQEKAKANPVECAVCQFVVGYVEKYIQNNKSQAAVDAALEKVCGLLPHALNATCVSFVDQYAPVLLQYIIAHGTPDAVCQALHLCSNKSEIIVPKTPAVSPQCSLCEFVIQYIEKAVGNNRSAAAVEAALDKVCLLLPGPTQTLCLTFVNKSGPSIATLIAQNLTVAQICDSLKMCNNGTEAVVEIEKPKVNPVECAICQFVVGYVDKYIQNNKSQAAVDAALEKVCALLPHALNASCVSFVDQYAPVLLQYIIAHGTPDAVCQALHLCSNKSEIIVPSVSPQCSLCEFVIQYIEKAVGNNRSAAAVEAALDKVCLLLPGPTQTLCLTFVNKSGPSIATLIAQNLTVAQICDSLKMCNNGTQKHKRIETVGGAECQLCKVVVSYVDAVIQTNQSEAAVNAALEKVCSIIPHSLSSACVQFVDTFGPKLVEYIAKYETPDKVCAALGLCKNGSEIVAEVESVKVEQEPVGSPLCSLCEFVVGYVLKVVENNKTDAAIEHALEKVCLLLPESKRNECVAFVDKYGTELIELIQKFGTPKLVCAALGVCAFNAQPVAPVRGTECALCKYVVAYVDAVIQTNQSEAAVDAALEKVCKILPHSLNSSCIQFVDTFGPELVEYIAKYGTPDKVCAAMGLCKNGSQIVESKVQINLKKPAASDSECSLCKYVISYVDLLLESNKTEEEVVKALDGICKILPEKDHAKCEAFVSTYGPILPQLVAELDDPNVVCDWLSMCKKSSNIPSVKLDAHHNFTCTLCEYLVNYLDAIVASNSTEVKFEEELEKACKILPTSKTQGECKTLVDLYSVDIIKFVVELGQPEKVCKEIGICEK